jgi:hypothetical protein
MCELVSVAVMKKGEFKMLVGENVNSHSDMAELNKVGNNDYYEAEWTKDDKGESLTVRTEDGVSSERYIKSILGHYPKRIDLINAAVCVVAKRCGYLDLNGLTSAKGLKLPETVGSLDLRGLTSAKGLKLPETVGGYLYLSGLTSAKGLKLPETVGGYLDLSGLTSAEFKKLPEKYQHKIIG